MPSAPWPAALDAIDAAARAALADLDGYEARWGEALASGGRQPPETSTHQVADAPRSPEPDWDARFAAVDLLAEAANADITDRAAAVARWRESLQRAVKLAEGAPCPASP